MSAGTARVLEIHPDSVNSSQGIHERQSPAAVHVCFRPQRRFFVSVVTLVAKSQVIDATPSVMAATGLRFREYPLRPCEFSAGYPAPRLGIDDGFPHEALS
jgi:hypothetical protein